MSSSLKTGTVLHAPEHDYTILKVLGQGGFGITYLAETDLSMGHLKFKAKVAIKEHFISSLCGRDGATHSVKYSEPVANEVECSLRAFVKEAHRLHDLGISHPNIVKVNEVFEANNTAYYVMEYLDGEDLESYVKRVGSLSEADAYTLLLPLVHAVAQLHRNKVAHYDIKPQNVMLAKDANGEMQPTLIDFGLAKHYDNQGHATSTITAAGYSPGYAPAEQYGGIKSYSPQCDVYSLGATIYYCLTGKTPNVAFVLKTTEIDAELKGRISDNLRTVIVRALQRDSDDRYASAVEMFDALCANVPTSKTTVKLPVGSNIGATTPQPVTPETVVPSPKPNWLKIGILSGALLVVLAVILAVLLPDKPESPIVAGVDSVVAKTPDTVVVAETIHVEKVVKEVPQTPQPAQTPVSETRLTRPKPAAEQPVVSTPAPTPQPQPAPQAPATSGYINGHEWVDLGLSVKWATCNVGASSPSGYGNYYAWGETSTKSEYTESNSKTYGDSSYGNIGGNYSTDAARANWGGTWRLPSKSECEELKDRCTWTWTTQGGSNGYKVKGPNGNTIFLPAAGDRNGTSLGSAGELGYYWSSTPYSDSYCAYFFYFYSSSPLVHRYNRYNGFPVRPVSE